MQEAFGGILNIVIIAIFLVIVEGILGFTVNYTKAFKMKNVVISAMEEYEAAKCVGDSSQNSACREKIRSGANQIGYAPSNLACPNGYDSIDNLFCVTEIQTNSSHENSIYVSYRIVTQVDVNVPIIRNIMGFSFFQVSGDTRVIQKADSR